MYKILLNQSSIEKVFVNYKKLIFSKEKKLICFEKSNFIYPDLQQLKEFSKFIDILESEVYLKDILTFVDFYNCIILIDMSLNDFENEFLYQFCSVNNFNIFNFKF